MTNCPVCDEKIDKDWRFCSYCGNNLIEEVYEENLLDKVRYLWERREGGKNIFTNFKIVRNLGDFAYKNVEPVRKKLGDFEHINLVNLHRFSFLYINPNQIYELYNISKLVGYYMADGGIRGSGIVKLIDRLNKTGLFWKVFQNDIFQEKYEEGWKKVGAAIIKLVDIDKNEKKQTYLLSECPSSVLHASYPICFMEMGALCGCAEGVFKGTWDGREIKCQAIGDLHNEVEIYLHDAEEKTEIDLITKEELDRILDEIIDTTVDRCKLRSGDIGDFFYIIVDQVMNYYLISLSPGHAIVSKHSGKVCGKRIAEKTGIHGLENAFKYLEDLFLYLKAGIFEKPEKRGDRYFIEMSESAYASGVENIHTHLCTFLAGIIEGFLDKTTGEKWFVDEIQCIASGYNKCKFMCKPMERCV